MAEHYAYSLLTVKSVQAERRQITGIATTPEPDRTGDVVVPTGVTFKNPVPLLLHHDRERPVGLATFQKPTAAGVPFEATFPIVSEPEDLKKRVDLAWGEIKAGLIKGVSIGFRVLDDGIEQLKSGGLKFLKTEVLELSLVTIPANASATILTVKSLDSADLAALGHHTSGVTDTAADARKGAPAMNIQEQITSYENMRASKHARMTALMTKSVEEGRTFDSQENDEYADLSREVADLDNHILKLKDFEKTIITTATPVTGVTSQKTATEVRGGTNVITVTPMVPKGTAFTRKIMAIAATRGNKWEAAEYAKRWDSTTPEVHLELKAAIAAGTTTDATWAGPLAVATPMSNEFLELLRPATLLGRIPNLRRVPFNISIPSQTAGGTYGWVGQGKPKPLTNSAFATVTLGINKIAGIIVLTEELVRLSTPSAEETVRAEMIAGITTFMDQQFIDPAVAASGTVSPASITNGTTPVTSAGTSSDNARTDLKALMASFIAANLSTANAVWIMSEANAFALAMAVNALGQPQFPGMSASGGTLFGLPVITSQSAGNVVALVDAQGILVADDGGVNVDVSREASLQMDSAPDDPATATTVMVSMFQHNLVALRAERFVTWKRSRTASVKYVSQAYA